jgi:hypothetical protein
VCYEVTCESSEELTPRPVERIPVEEVIKAVQEPEIVEVEPEVFKEERVVPEVPTVSEPAFMEEMTGLPMLRTSKPIGNREKPVEFKSKVMIPDMPKPKDKHRAVYVPGHSEIFDFKKRNFTLPRLFAATLAPKN